MISRKRFISLSGSAFAAVCLAPESFSIKQGHRLKKLGFISGIIDKELRGDWRTVLKKAASYGYTEIETGSYMGESAVDYLTFLKEIGLLPVAGGISFNSGEEELVKNFNLLRSLEMGIAVVYWPWYTGGPFSLEDCKRSVERLNYLGEKCKAHGLQFCWHNHDKEFIAMESGLPFDYIMNNTDPSVVKCELDIYWVRKGGADPVEMLKKYRGRYLILHIKDMAPGTAMDFECPGNGIIDFPPVFSEAYSQGIDHFMVERDNVPDGMACLQSAADYLKNLEF